MSETKEIIILVGIPGSGKSTFAKEFFGEDVYKKHVVSSDYFIDEYASKMKSSYTKEFKGYIKEATKLMNERFTKLSKKGELIIWDQTNVSMKKRKEILSRPELKGYTKKCIAFFPQDESLYQERLKAREKSDKKKIPSSIIESMKENLECPVPYEGFDNITYVYTCRGKDIPDHIVPVKRSIQSTNK